MTLDIPTTPYTFKVSFTDKAGEIRSAVKTFTYTEDEWESEDIDDLTAFDINIFESENKLCVNVYQLDPKRKKEGLWTNDGMRLLTVNSFEIISS